MSEIKDAERCVGPSICGAQPQNESRTFIGPVYKRAVEKLKSKLPDPDDLDPDHWPLPEWIDFLEAEARE